MGVLANLWYTFKETQKRFLIESVNDKCIACTLLLISRNANWNDKFPSWFKRHFNTFFIIRGVDKTTICHREPNITDNYVCITDYDYITGYELWVLIWNNTLWKYCKDNTQCNNCIWNIHCFVHMGFPVCGFLTFRGRQRYTLRLCWAATSTFMPYW